MLQGLSLGKPQHRPEDGSVVEIGSDAISNSSDSNTFYEEDFSSSDDGRYVVIMALCSTTFFIGCAILSYFKNVIS